MRHNKKNNHLGRKTAHRSAMLSNMATSLIMHKRIFTTVPKAKELRKYVEPLITKCKDDTTNSRREVFSKLQNKYAVSELFQTVARKVGDRPGGYTRILKTGFRLGDNAAMCFIELVDFNENMLGEGKTKRAKTRRSRRKSSSATAAAPAAEPQKEKTIKESETAVEPAAAPPAEEKGEEEPVEKIDKANTEEANAETPGAAAEKETETDKQA